MDTVHRYHVLSHSCGISQRCLISVIDTYAKAARKRKRDAAIASADEDSDPYNRTKTGKE